MKYRFWLNHGLFLNLYQVVEVEPNVCRGQNCHLFWYSCNIPVICAGARATNSGKLADSENSEKIATF